MSFRITSPSSVSIGGTITGGTTGSVLFINPTNIIAQDNANFFWDDTNNILRSNKLAIGYNSFGSGGATFALGSALTPTAATTDNTEDDITLFAKAPQGASTLADGGIGSNGGGFKIYTGTGGDALGDGGTGGDGGSITIVLADGGTGGDQTGSGGAFLFRSPIGTQLLRFSDGTLTITGGFVAANFNTNGSSTSVLTYNAGLSNSAPSNTAMEMKVLYSGTVAAGFGLRQQYTAQYSIANFTAFIGYHLHVWDDVTSLGTLKAHYSIFVGQGSTPVECFRAWTDGTQGNVVIGVGTGIASTRLTVYSGVSTYKGMVIRGASSQSANLLELQDSSPATLASHDAAGRLRFDTASAGVTNEGTLWADSTQKAMQVYVDGIEQTLSGTIFTQTADATVSNTTTETTIFGSGVGTLTLPAAFFVAGKTIGIMMSGVYSTVAVTGDTVTVKIKYGSTVIASKATTGLLTGATNNYWFAEAMITCRTTGSSGTVQCSGGVRYQVASSVVVEDELNNSAGTTTINTTTSNAIDVTVTHSAANGSNSVKSLVASVEVLN